MRNYVLGQLLERRYVAIATSPAVDFALVLRNCIAAHRRELIRKIWLLASLILMIVGVLYGQLTWAAGALIAAFLLVLTEKWITTFHVVPGNFTRMAFVPEVETTESSRRIAQVLNYVNAQSAGNVVVYSGYSPFAGSGVPVSAWSFVLDLTKKQSATGLRDISVGSSDGSADSNAGAFDVKDLYDFLTSSITNLGFPNLSIRDVLFVNGRRIRDDRRFLPSFFSRPNTSVDQSLVELYAQNPSESVRYYKHLRVVNWSGELVLSIFLRLLKSNQTLFIEVSNFMLPPVLEKYHSADNVWEHTTIRKRVAILLASLVETPYALLNAPVSLLAVVVRPVRLAIQRWWERRLILENPSFDYGARASVREAYTSTAVQQYFQKLDEEMYFKAIERRILDTITEFLEARNIDTSDIKERRTTILNHGVIITGGSIQAEALAVGDKSASVVRRVTSSVLRPKRRATLAR